MVYPLFLKLTNYIGILAQNPKNASASETPEMMIGHLHKYVIHKIWVKLLPVLNMIYSIV